MDDGVRVQEILVPRAGPASILQMRERDLAPPGQGEALVRVEAAGVAYADIVVRRGLYGDRRPPVVPGYDFVGRVEAVGDGVEHLKPGDRVAGVTVTGSYATHMIAQARWLVPAPEHIPAANLVAAVLNGVTAYQMFTRLAPASEGEWALVHGAAGGVGSLLVELARRSGVNVAGSGSAGKRDVIAAMGAEPLDYTRDDVPGRAKALSNGGVMAAYDPIGPGHLRRNSLPALGRGGAAVLYGGYDATRGGKVRPLAVAAMLTSRGISPWKLFTSGHSLATYSVEVWRDHRTALYRRDLADVLAMVASGALKPMIGAILPLARAAEAHRALESRSMAGKIVLSMQDS